MKCLEAESEREQLVDEATEMSGAVVKAERNVCRDKERKISGVVNQVNRLDVRHTADDAISVRDPQSITLRDLDHVLHQVEALNAEDCEEEEIGAAADKARCCRLPEPADINQ